MTKPTLVLTSLLLAVLLQVGSTAAQIRINVQLVNVVATVTDSRGRYVSGLKASDFKVMEDGAPQEIAHFSSSNDQPVSVGIVLDSSISMERKMTTATRAVDRFLRDIHEDDDIFLMTFDQSVRVRQDFTSDREKLWAALDKVNLGSGTSLYDGVIAGVDKIRKGKYPKKAILLISDGVDTTSERDYSVARMAVRESEMLVYALGIAPDAGVRAPMSERPPVIINSPRGPATSPFPLPSPFPFPFPIPGQRQFPGGGGSTDLDTVDMRVLHSFADESGGKAWLIASDNRRDRLQAALDEIADELRNQYSIGYYPSHDLKDGKWHRIEIIPKNPSYHVRYKQDYLGK
jgi:Ca-activated chloride channel family protein